MLNFAIHTTKNCLHFSPNDAGAQGAALGEEGNDSEPDNRPRSNDVPWRKVGRKDESDRVKGSQREVQGNTLTLRYSS